MEMSCIVPFALVIFLSCWRITIQAVCNDSPEPPTCVDDCSGRRFYVGSDGLCKMCVQCLPGEEHDKYCGDGVNGDAQCITCRDEHFSNGNMYYECLPCRICENTEIMQECTDTTDRECGKCHFGFYRDPQNPDFCNQMCEWSGDPRSIRECLEWADHQDTVTTSYQVMDKTQLSTTASVSEEFTDNHTRTIVIAVLVILSALVILGLVLPLFMYYRHRNQPSRVDTSKENGGPGGTVIVMGPLEHPSLEDTDTNEGDNVSLPTKGDEDEKEVELEPLLQRESSTGGGASPSNGDDTCTIHLSGDGADVQTKQRNDGYDGENPSQDYHDGDHHNSGNKNEMGNPDVGNYPIGPVKDEDGGKQKESEHSPNNADTYSDAERPPRDLTQEHLEEPGRVGSAVGTENTDLSEMGLTDGMADNDSSPCNKAPTSDKSTHCEIRPKIHVVYNIENVHSLQVGDRVNHLHLNDNAVQDKEQ